MKYSDYGILISSMRFSSGKTIVKILCRDKGIQKGIVTTNKKNRNNLYTGNYLHFERQARLEEHLGKINFHSERSFGTLSHNDTVKSATIFSFCCLLDILLPEGLAYEKIYEELYNYLSQLSSNDNFLADYARLEFLLLDEIGYGFDFSKCAISGSEDIYYISPKTGNCVTQAIGKDYSDKLFVIPEFLKNNSQPTKEDAKKSIEITRYFLNKRILTEHQKDKIFAIDNLPRLL